MRLAISVSVSFGRTAMATIAVMMKRAKMSKTAVSLAEYEWSSASGPSFKESQI